jgi:dihydroxy-acid dehydratase
MACLVEALGLMLPGGAAPPHASGARLKNCVMSGRRAVYLAQNVLRPQKILTRASFLNALRVLAALSGSTNAIIHLLAIARRAQIELTLRDFDETSGRSRFWLTASRPAKATCRIFITPAGCRCSLKPWNRCWTPRP